MIFSLPKDIIFPPVELAEPNGMLAIGGDLSVERLLAAYKHGIFPWFSDGSPILWWSPDPRFVLFPDEIKVSKSMKQAMRNGTFTVTYDLAFKEVIRNCRHPRKDQDGTWITDDMEDAYIELHELGFAHSVETWQGDELVGGLYGVSLGRMFFGESMFTITANASKAALISLAVKLQSLSFDCIDCQVHTKHMETMGARYIVRTEFIDLLASSLKHKGLTGSWKDIHEFGKRLN